MELLTRETGEPDIVEVDGTGSEAGTSNIVAWDFRVVDSETDEVVFDPPPSGNALEVTPDPGLFPADYTASLVVVDALGQVSNVDDRNFSVK